VRSGPARYALARPPRNHPAEPADGDRRPVIPRMASGIARQLQAIHGADKWILVTGVSGTKKAGEIVGRAGSVLRHHAYQRRPHHKGCRRKKSPPRRRSAKSAGNGSTSPRPSRTLSVSAKTSRGRWIGEYTWRRAFSGDRIPPLSRRADARRSWIFSKSHSSSLRGATRRSNPFSLAHDGLLRRACHRARIRATRWLQRRSVIALGLSSSTLKASSSCGEIATLSFSPVGSRETNHLL